METKNLLKSLKRRLGLITAILAMLAVSQGTMATDHTVYFAPSTSWVGSYTVKAYYKYGNGTGENGLVTMTKTAYTYAGKPIYSATIYEQYGGLNELDFQCFDGNTYKKEAKAFDSWWTTPGFSGRLYPTTESKKDFADYTQDRLHGNFGDGWKDYTFENGSVSITLSANTTYEFGVRYPKDDDWKGQTGESSMTRSSNSWTLDGSKNVKLDADVAGSYTFSITDNSGNPVLTVTYPTACTTPSSGFDAEGQLNAGQGSPWEGSKSDNATGGYFANNYRTITLTTDVDIDAYSWTCVTKPDGSTINWTNQTSKTATAQVNLPGVYTFKVAVNCTGGSSVESETVTVTVPYPEVGISGPLYNGSWNHGAAGNEGPKFTRNGLTYTNTFDINQKGEFVIIQRYKLGCKENNGWDGYQECSAISGNNGNKINNSTLTNEGGFANYGSGVNFTTNLDVSGGSTVKITVTMTDYDSYSIKIEKKCDNPVITANPSTEAQTLCEGVDATQLSVTATGTDCTYQWYSYTNAGGTTGEASISGATSASYKPATTTAGTLYYRCKVTACETTVQSNVSGGITVKAGPGAVTKLPTDVHPYEVTTFTASGSGAASAEWSIQTHPSGVTADEAYLLGTTTGTNVKFKGEAANGYVVRAAANGCNTDTQFNVVADPNNCN